MQKEFVEQYLKNHNINYILHTHPSVFTVEEAEKHCTHIPGMHCKNLFLRDKHKNYYLLILPAKKQTELKKFAELTNLKKISFGSPEALLEKLGLTPGSVSPFGLLNDHKKEVTVFIDKEVYDAEIVNFHPNTNTASVELTKEMFHKYLKTLKHKIETIEL